MSHHVVVVAGGSGTRMQSGMPKQFIELCGKPILMHTIASFSGYQSDINVIVVLPESQITYWHELCDQYRFDLPHQVTAGGSARFHSVKNGLAQLPGSGLVAVHDGVRPLVSRQTITNCFDEAGIHGNAIPVIPVIDSVRQLDSTGSHIIDRSNLRLIQTPQVFDLAMLRKAYEQEYSDIFTDDASVFEQAGHQIHLVDGNPENIKITTPYDLVIARSLITG